MEYFDYSTCKPELQKWLRDAAEIFEERPESEQDILKAGRVLVEAKEKLGHGKFSIWVATESDWNKDLTARLMAVAKLLPQISQVAKFEFLAVAQLASKKIPAIVRQTALAEIASGQTFTFERLRELLGKSTRQPSKQEKIAAASIPPIERLFEQFDTVYLFSVKDAEGQEVAYHGRATNSAARLAVHEVRDDPLQLLKALAGEEAKLTCSACGCAKPEAAFEADPKMKNGFRSACRECEFRAKNERRKKRKSQASGS